MAMWGRETVWLTEIIFLHRQTKKTFSLLVGLWYGVVPSYPPSLAFFPSLFMSVLCIHLQRCLCPSTLCHAASVCCDWWNWCPPGQHCSKTSLHRQDIKLHNRKHCECKDLCVYKANMAIWIELTDVLQDMIHGYSIISVSPSSCIYLLHCLMGPCQVNEEWMNELRYIPGWHMLKPDTRWNRCPETNTKSSAGWVVSWFQWPQPDAVVAV